MACHGAYLGKPRMKGAASRPGPLAMQCPEKRPVPRLSLNGDLRADFDDALGGNLEEGRRIVRGLCEPDEQAVLPARHPRMRRGFQRTAREKKRRRHDVEGPAELSCLRE